MDGNFPRGLGVVQYSPFFLFPRVLVDFLRGGGHFYCTFQILIQGVPRRRLSVVRASIRTIYSEMSQEAFRTLVGLSFYSPLLIHHTRHSCTNCHFTPVETFEHLSTYLIIHHRLFLSRTRTLHFSQHPRTKTILSIRSRGHGHNILVQKSVFCISFWLSR